MHLYVTLLNHSAVGCSYDTGPFSPNLVLSNSEGATVWGSCWFGGGPAPCAYFLRRNVLAPGATYRDRLTWDERTGHPDLPAPVGRYTLTANLQGLALVASTSFDMIRSHFVTVTLGDLGRHYALSVGDYLVVRLVDPPLGWTSARSSTPRTVNVVTEVNPVAGLFVYRALRPGIARISAVGNPTCYPECLMASRNFFVTVSVLAP